MDRFWHTNTMEYYTAIRMNELQLPARVWVNHTEKGWVKEIDTDESTLCKHL